MRYAVTHESQFWNEPNLAPTQVKRQHYIPRMYLKAFTGADGKIHAVDLDEDTDFRTSVEKVAVRNYFNDVEIGDERLSTEGWLSELEGEAVPVLAKLINDPISISSLSLGEEFHIARFIVALKFRTPAFRQWDAGMTAQFASETKEIIKSGLYNQLEKEEADVCWDIGKDKPDHWWPTQSDQYQPSAMAASMLGEVQGFANLLLAAPWRIGSAPDSIQLYTSDNPVSSYLRPVRPWWQSGAFSGFDYFLPLSPCILLKIEQRPNREEKAELERRGTRRYRNFSSAEISFARHVVTMNANRYLFGEGLMVPRACATSCIKRIDQAKLRFAMRYLGFDPGPPASLRFPM
jgi:hypothetical protein